MQTERYSYSDKDRERKTDRHIDKKSNWKDETDGALKGPNRTEEGKVGGEGV